MNALIDSLFFGFGIGAILAVLLVGLLWGGAKLITSLDWLDKAISTPALCAILILIVLAFKLAL